eukprot:Gregarina_sp_Poly_1__8490@NODE_4_length_26097_cov_247_784211_g3_i0_p6_GENE_NODE_4_length_26097_cov_247_784211_g3_i0NODE_4_length_26097_cov_247_784211_g3_i0_p6_ORF_typecomplete_len515_score83_01_NODE_4_length_26097_cov_247_784211_g3_i02273624280
MINLYLCGEIPLRDVPNFSARRFTTFATKWAFVDQQRYWRAILEKPGLWSLPRLRNLTVSGTGTAGSETWQQMIIAHMLPPQSTIEVLELARTIRSPAEALQLPFDAEIINPTKFPVLNCIIVRCVYGVETLAVVQRLFSLWLERPITAQTRELVLADHHRLATEACRLETWMHYQTRRAGTLALSRPRTGGMESGVSFWAPGESRRLRFRLLFGGEDYDPDEVEDKLMSIASSKLQSSAERRTMQEVDARGTLEELDSLVSAEAASHHASFVYFHDVEELHFDIGTYEEASKHPGLFDIVSDRLMQLRFVKGSYSQRHRGRVAEFIPVVKESPEGDSGTASAESNVETSPPSSQTSGDLPARPTIFRVNSNESIVLGLTGRRPPRPSLNILEDVSDVGRVQPRPPALQRHRLTSALLFDGEVDDHRRLLAVPVYEWPKEEPESTETTLRKLKVTLRYGMGILDRDLPMFGPDNGEAYRRVQIARKWIAFNPTLKSVSSKLLELKTAPEKSLDQ